MGGGSVIGKYAFGKGEYEAGVFGNGDGDQSQPDEVADASQQGEDKEGSAVLELMDDEGETVLVVDDGDQAAQEEPPHTHGGSGAVTTEGVVKIEQGGDVGGNGGMEVPMVGTMEIGGF